MAKLIIGYGPAGSGKSTAAHAWKRHDYDHRLVVDEGDFSPATMDRLVMPQLQAGNDVWLNILTSSNATSLSVGPLSGHTVEMRKFVGEEAQQ